MCLPHVLHQFRDKIWKRKYWHYIIIPILDCCCVKTFKSFIPITLMFVQRVMPSSYGYTATKYGWTCGQKSLIMKVNCITHETWGETNHSSRYSDSRATRAIFGSLSLSLDRLSVRKPGQLLRKNCFWLTHSRHVTMGKRAYNKPYSPQCVIVLALDHGTLYAV